MTKNTNNLLITLGLGTAAAVGFAVLWPSIAKALTPPTPQPQIGPMKPRFVGDLVQNGDVVLIDVAQAGATTPAMGNIAPLPQQLAQVLGPTTDAGALPSIKRVVLRVHTTLGQDIIGGDIVGTPDIQLQDPTKLMFGPAYASRASVIQVERNGQPVVLLR